MLLLRHLRNPTSTPPTPPPPPTTNPVSTCPPASVATPSPSQIPHRPTHKIPQALHQTTTTPDDPARYPLHAERVACILAATTHSFRPRRSRPALRPNLGPCHRTSTPRNKENAGLAAFIDAGYMRVGQLAYLRANTTAATADNDHLQPVPTDWPVASACSGFPTSQNPTATRPSSSLERTYEGTLDCPELCGLRSTTDVLDSHKSVGEFDPALWWIVMHNDQPAGCSLLNVSPPLQAAGLVYCGPSPAIRGQGLASPLLRLSMAAACRSNRATIKSVLCAVDLRNTPALRLYKRAGFEQTQVRIPLIRQLGAKNKKNP